MKMLSEKHPQYIIKISTDERFLNRPSPGAREAVEKHGCRCPRAANHHGAGASGLYYGFAHAGSAAKQLKEEAERRYFIVDSRLCPLHKAAFQ